MQPRAGLSTPRATQYPNTPADRANNSGIELFKQEKYAEALVAFGTGLALSYNPAPTIHCNAARALQKLKRHADAVSHLDRALGESLAGNYYDADIYALRGYSYFKLGKFTEAVKDLDQAIYYKCENLGFAYYYLGRAHQASKKTDQCINNLSKAISHKYSAISSAYYHRGLAYADIKNYDKALEDFKKVVTTENKHQASACYELGRLNSIVGHLDEALKFFELARDAGVANEMALYAYMGITYQAKGEYVDAIMCYEQALPATKNQNEKPQPGTDNSHLQGALYFCKGMNVVNELKILLKTADMQANESSEELFKLKAIRELEALTYFQQALACGMLTESMTIYAHIMRYKLSNQQDQRALAMVRLHAIKPVSEETPSETKAILLLCAFYSGLPQGRLEYNAKALLKSLTQNIVPPYLRDEVVKALVTSSLSTVSKPLNYSEFDDVEQDKQAIYKMISKVEDWNLYINALWQCLLPQTFLGSLFNIAQGYLGKKPSLYSSKNKRKIAEKLRELMSRDVRLDETTLKALKEDILLQAELAACYPAFHQFLVNAKFIPAPVLTNDSKAVLLVCAFNSLEKDLVVACAKELFKTTSKNVPPNLLEDVVRALTSPSALVSQPLKYNEFENVDQNKQFIFQLVMEVKETNLRVNALWQCLLPKTFLGSMFDIAQGLLGRKPSLYSSTNKRKIAETLEGLMSKDTKLDAHTFELLNSNEALQNELATYFPKLHKFLVNEQIIPAHVSNGIKYYLREDRTYVSSTTATPEGHKSTQADIAPQLTLGFLQAASNEPLGEFNAQSKPADPNSEPKPESPRGP